MKKILALVLALAMLLSCTAVFADEGFAGGWTVSEDGALTEAAAEAFKKATENLDGIEPLMLLGTQVVAGINYEILVKVTGEDGVYFAALVIYAGLDGSATIMSEHVIPFGIEYDEETEEDGQNPVMNFIGEYQDRVGQRAALTVTAIEDGALLSLTWANDVASGVVWTFMCTFDPEALVFSYDQGVKQNYTATENGEITYETVAENLTGSFVIDENEVITWVCEGEDADNGCEFVWVE